jgi:hypothetical protein
MKTLFLELLCLVILLYMIVPLAWDTNKNETTIVKLYSDGKVVETMECSRGIAHFLSLNYCVSEKDGETITKEFNGTFVAEDIIKK